MSSFGGRPVAAGSTGPQSSSNQSSGGLVPTGQTGDALGKALASVSTSRSYLIVQKQNHRSEWISHLKLSWFSW